MTTNKGQAALNDYTEELQKIVSCVARDVCFVYPNREGRQALAWSQGPVKLKRNDGGLLYIDISQEIDDPVPENKDAVSTREYIYSILDAEEKDLIGFHYHPDLDDDPVLYPHIHVYADADKRFSFFNLHKRHIPSGRVALEDVIEWLIIELEIKPLREDWKEILQGTREKFKQSRTWA